MSAGTPRALFAGPGAARALVTGRTGVVELTLSAGAYLSFGPDWVLLSEHAAPFAPLSLIVSRLPGDSLSVSMPVEVRGGRLVLGDLVVSLTRVRERRAPALAVPPPSRGSHAAATAAAALSALPPAPPALRPGIESLSGGRIADGVLALAGLGDGLTPAGDDVLTGAAAVHSQFGRRDGRRMSTVAAGRASALGLAYMRCAERGELPDPGAELLAAIMRGSGSAARAAMTRVQSWGASSGTALAWGICAGVLASAPVSVLSSVSRSTSPAGRR
jgi:hypothetical protein